MALFIVVRGRTGTGKSALARGLVDALGFVHLDYDSAMMKSYESYEGGSGLEGVRDLSRHEGRTQVGLEAAPLLAQGRSVVIDADLRDSAELDDLLSSASLSRDDPRVLVVRLEASRKVAAERRLRDDWPEFRFAGRARAVRVFDALWSYPLMPIPGERSIETDRRSADEVLEAVCAVIREVGWDRPGSRAGPAA